MAAETVYLEAYYPHTSLAFLVPSLLLFTALTMVASYILWPVAIPFALVTLYLLRFAVRQARGPDLAIRVTGDAVYYRGWEGGLWREELRGGVLPLQEIGHVELLNLRSVVAAGPIVAIWLSDPGALLRSGPVRRLTREISAGGDLAIACDETDHTADQVRAAIETAMAAS